MYGTSASPENLRSKLTYSVCRTDSLTILRSSEFTSKKCVMELNRAANAPRTKSEIADSLRCYQVYM